MEEISNRNGYAECLKWLCLETIQMYKSDTVKGSYSRGVYSGGGSLAGRGGEAET